MKAKLFIFSFLTLNFFGTANSSPVISNETEYNTIVDTIFSIYTDVATSHHSAQLIFEKNWLNETVNAQAIREGETQNIWKIIIPGGMARAPGMTQDSFALVLCHELGHHLGGAPQSFLYGGWASAEGQADYWATSKCLKKYFYELRSGHFTYSEEIPNRVIADCTRVYSTALDQQICVRTMMASIEFGYFLNTLATPKTVIQIETPDTRVVKGTNFNDYPRAQCRFDTLYQGALCPISFTQMTSTEDPSIASCNSYEIPGARPLCWYYPEVIN